MHGLSGSRAKIPKPKIDASTSVASENAVQLMANFIPPIGMCRAPPNRKEPYSDKRNVAKEERRRKVTFRQPDIKRSGPSCCCLMAIDVPFVKLRCAFVCLLTGNFFSGVGQTELGE